MTSEDIRSVTFEKSMRGYRVEDVDDFLLQVANQLDELSQANEAAKAAQQDMESKMYILAQKVEEYRGEEDTLKTALINAQRMGETVVKEAKQKAETLVRDATGQAELLREQAEQEILHEQIILEKLQSEVTRFKATVLNLYKQHIESLSALDAPVAHVDEFLRENADELFAEEEVEYEEYESYEDDSDVKSYVIAEPELPDNKEEAAQAAGIPTEPPSLDEIPVVNLFEGIPIDNG